MSGHQHTIPAQSVVHPKRGRLDRRIEDITERLREAEATDAVGVGSTVTVRFPGGEAETLRIAELAEALDQTLVTADSPLGRALLGRRPGDTVRHDTPDGPATAVVVSIGEPPAA
ncbi:GreA/GreB family elongation factor [Streptomyces sp. NPDC017638]|uniref:GreA/GreB family elongation factor n=1 Tax=Streptomyces sp. NPDC017638 TaxID=3365004 RepID=UPI00378F2029